MEWLKRLFNKPRSSELDSSNARILAREVWEAHEDWKVAQLKLNEALDQDQIDYAIYITEATQKRFNMLLREAREQKLDMTEYGFQFQEAKKNTLDM